MAGSTIIPDSKSDLCLMAALFKHRLGGSVFLKYEHVWWPVREVCSDLFGTLLPFCIIRTAKTRSFCFWEQNMWPADLDVYFYPLLSCTSFLHHLQSKSFRIGSGHVVSSVTAQQKGSGPKTAGQLEALLRGVSMSQCLGGFSKSTPASCHRLIADSKLDTAVDASQV